MGEHKSCEIELFQTFHKFKKLNISKMLPELSMVEMHTMMSIDHAMQKKDGVKGAAVSNLCKNMEVPPAGLSRTLRGLEQRGYLERKTDKNDRRHTYVTLTEEGEQLVVEVKRIMHDFSNAVFAKMGEKDVERLNAYLLRMYEVAQQEISNRTYNKKENDNDEEDI